MNKPDTKMMMELITRLHPLHRTLVHEDMDKALEIIGEYLPSQGEYRINRYPSHQKIWTWKVPEKFVVEEAWVELLEPEGARRIIDFEDNPLHLISYSPSFEGEMSFDELAPRLYSNPDRPDGIPWHFRYYDRDWGFCLTDRLLQQLPRDGRYRVKVNTRFEPGEMGVGEWTMEGASGDYLLITTDICHPYQVNDSISGVVAAVDFACRVADDLQGRLGIKILFLPETIGSIAYFANNEDMIERFPYAIYGELFGHDNTMTLQRSRQNNTVLDRVAESVLNEYFSGDFVDRPFCSTIITNDEKVSNAPGVDIPTIALHRFPYERYHTSEDTPDQMVPEKLADVSVIYQRIFSILHSNYYPRRKFRGPLFISGLGLDFDWKQTRNIKRGLQDVTTMLEGDLSVFDIAEKVDLPFNLVMDFLDVIRDKGLIEAYDLPYIRMYTPGIDGQSQ